MGGGASLMEGMEELMTTTILIGRAISAVTFPGMYRIYDFHSNEAPKLKNQQKFSPFFAQDSDDEEDTEYVIEQTPDPNKYEKFFKLVVGEDIIYIEDPLQTNDAGWTPLHTCCMSLTTVNAGLSLIDEIIRRGGHFETKTIYGPGTFNKGWTALQMACAYGVEPLVEKLVTSGANVNACNSFGYSCMLEACHRGYIVVAKYLLKTGAVNLAYIPKESDAMNSPFASAPCQSALAEAARCGFFKVVQTLLDAGAPKDLSNRLGWTALHEACFYNRMETVKMLLLSGADPSKRSRQGALPYHLACIPEIKNMLENMGGPGAVPNAGDVVDMLQILTELTMPADIYEQYNNDMKQIEDDMLDIDITAPIHNSIPSKTMVFIDQKQPQDQSSLDHKGSTTTSVHHENIRSKNDMKIAFDNPGNINTKGGISTEESEAGGYLHSGPILGNLPALPTSNNNNNNSNNKTSPYKSFQSEVDQVLTKDFYRVSTTTNRNMDTSHASLFNNQLITTSNSMKAKQHNPSFKADEKNKKKKKKKHNSNNNNNDDVPIDMPDEYICQLTRKPLSEPMKTIYGNIYDKTAIMNWLNTQGKICPLTGAPLSEIDLIPLPELGDEIRHWFLKRSIQKNTEISLIDNNNNNNLDNNKSVTTAVNTNQNDELYDF